MAHGSFQGAVSGIQGGNFWQGFASGAAASIASSLWSGGNMAKGGAWNGIGGKFAKSGAGMITFGTISGGAGAALTGGNFWQGAATGFVVSAVTHLARDKGKTIVYERTNETDESTIGTFTVSGTDIEGYFLEPPGPSTTTPNQNRRIPAGTYNIEKYSGTKYKDVYILYNDEVPKSRAILIHNGSIPAHTRGCLLCGTNYVGPNFINGSRRMLNILRNQNINRMIIHDPKIP